MGDDDVQAFWDDGYCRIGDLVSPKQCRLIRNAMELSRDRGEMRVADNRAYRGPHNQYAPLIGQLLLGSLAPRLSERDGRTLLPSFAFWRIYRKGDVLNRHTDRKSCEVSVTIAVAAEPEDQAWPICLKDLHGREHAVALKPGSGVLYQGTRVEHWREPLAGEAHFQMFLHYVVEGGPHAARALDGGISQVPELSAKP
jgi:hypothetical protein